MFKHINSDGNTPNTKEESPEGLTTIHENQYYKR